MSRARHVQHLNRVLRASDARARDLEDALTEALIPVLEEAGRYAASRFRKLATAHLHASADLRRADRYRLAQAGYEAGALLKSLALTAAGPLQGVQSNSTMIAVKPRPDEAAAIADPDGSPADDLHVTLAYLGEVDGDLSVVLEALAQVAATHAPLVGVVGGYGEFRPPGVGILLPDVPGLVELRVAVTEALVRSGITYGREHGFQPHITVDGSPEDGEIDEMLARAAGAPLHFDALLVVRGNTETLELPLTGVPALTAAAGESAGFCLPSHLRTKADPIRAAAATRMARDTIEGVGLSFDVTNPLISGAIANTGSHIQAISQTTQVDVMRTVRAAYEEGLSIPDAAEAIRAKMYELAPVRARMIARTEIAGAVNSASLASARVVDASLGEDSTAGDGGGLFKQWLTAPGAKYPRHEDYDGLDGQTTSLNDLFDVGGSQMDHPADPNGDPAEVINCRCTMGYTDDTADLTASLGARLTLAASGHAPAHGCEVIVDPDADAAELVALQRTLAITAAGGPKWTSPAAEEILPIGCAAAQVRTGKALGAVTARDLGVAERDASSVVEDLGGGAISIASSVAPGASKMYVDPDVPPTLYRTEHAHAAYKGKAVWGEGRYYGTDLETTANLQLDPDEAGPLDMGDVSKVDSYRLPPAARILEIYPDSWTDEQLQAHSGKALRAKVLASGYDGVHVVTESANLGGDQIVLYRPLADIQKRYDIAIAKARARGR